MHSEDTSFETLSSCCIVQCSQDISGWISVVTPAKVILFPQALNESDDKVAVLYNVSRISAVGSQSGQQLRLFCVSSGTQ